MLVKVAKASNLFNHAIIDKGFVVNPSIFSLFCALTLSNIAILTATHRQLNNVQRFSIFFADIMLFLFVLAQACVHFATTSQPTSLAAMT
jgi:hypothetical protein